MVKSGTILHTQPRKKKRGRSKGNSGQFKKFASMGRISVGIINELHSPIDSTNRFINLALRTIGEDSQSRQFLLESKQGIRKTAQLLKRLNNYVGKLEKEFRKMSEHHE